MGTSIFCDWFNIPCRYMSSSGLIGEIDPSFGQLTLLQHLYVLYSFKVCPRTAIYWIVFSHWKL